MSHNVFMFHNVFLPHDGLVRAKGAQWLKGMAVAGVISVAGCGGSDSDTKTTSARGANVSLPGTLYYPAQSHLMAMDLDAGLKLSLTDQSQTSYHEPWVSRDGQFFTRLTQTRVRGEDRWSVELYERSGQIQISVLLEEGQIPFTAARLSPDQQYLLVGIVLPGVIEQSHEFVVFDREGRRVRTIAALGSNPERFADADWLPDGRLVLVQGKTFYVSERTATDFGEWKPVAISESLPQRIEVDPSGQFVAYNEARYRDGTGEKQQIVRLELKNGAMTAITATEGSAYAPSWSPDGRYIAFRHDWIWHRCQIRSDVGRYCTRACTDISVVSADGRDIDMRPGEAQGAVIWPNAYAVDGESGSVCTYDRVSWGMAPEESESSPGTGFNGGGVNAGLEGKLLLGSALGAPRYIDVNSGERVTLSNDASGDTFPHMAYGGDRVVFEGTTAVADTDRILIQTLDGQPLNAFTHAQDNAPQRPKISLDGRYIAMSWNPGSNPEQAGFVLMSPDGSYLPQHRLQSVQGWDWFQDGRLLIHYRNRIDSYQPDTNERETLVEFAQTVAEVALSPNNRWVAFRLSGHIWVARLDGSDLRQLTASASMESHPQWSPNGQAVSFVHEGELYAVPADAQRAFVNGPERIETSVQHLRAYDRFTNTELSPVEGLEVYYWR